jgi:hypothetical protein
MLKTQLHSKIFQYSSEWRDIEDILTGDYFGVLDYLPRKPYLESFIKQLLYLNSDVSFPGLETVDWDQVELQFWPMKTTDEANAEPDLIILSDKWVIIVEVKLNSGLGNRQLWREHHVGQSIGAENNISSEYVYCLLLTRNRIKEAEVFYGLKTEQRALLSPKVIYLLWHEAAAIFESWSRYGISNVPLMSEHHRMITDLLNSLRKRRNLLFSGFVFHHMEQSQTFQSRIFSPELFNGFLKNIPTVNKLDYSLITNEFRGFCTNSRNCERLLEYWSNLQFIGFQNSPKKCNLLNMKFFTGDRNELN